MSVPHGIRVAALVLVATLLAGCASAPGIPDTTYYRLPPRADIAALEQPAFGLPIVVDTFLADGVHSDQALLYALDADASRLRAYHYQLWVDPPVRMLQRRLIATLREARIAPLVVDSLPASVDALRVTGRLQRFERVPRGNDWSVSVSVGLRADLPGRQRPIFVRVYRENVDVDGRGVADSVQAMGAALDRIYARFVGDLAAVAPRGEAAP